MVASVLCGPRRESICQASNLRKRLALWFTYVDGRLSSYATVGDAKEALLYNRHNSRERPKKPLSEFPAASEPQTFFARDSMCLSRERSATSRFNPCIFFFHPGAGDAARSCPGVRTSFPTCRRSLTDLGARLRLAQRVDDLLFGNSQPPHRALLSSGTAEPCSLL